MKICETDHYKIKRITLHDKQRQILKAERLLPTLTKYISVLDLMVDSPMSNGKLSSLPYSHGSCLWLKTPQGVIPGHPGRARISAALSLENRDLFFKVHIVPGNKNASKLLREKCRVPIVKDSSCHFEIDMYSCAWLSTQKIFQMLKIDIWK